MKIFSTNILNSTFSQKSTCGSTEELQRIIDVRKQLSGARVNQVALKELDQWSFDNKGNLCHQSGKFFSVCGVRHKILNEKEQTQIIVNQPEVGILGIITKNIDEVLYFLMQFKYEPGNIGRIQLSPTVQATKSNYTAVHKGLPVSYLNYFFNNPESIFDIQLSEQASRFYKKINRNIIKLYEQEEELEILSDFRWLTLRQILDLIKQDNVVNMNARSIVSCIKFGEDGRTYSLTETEEYYTALCGSNIRNAGRDFFVSAFNTTLQIHDIDELKNWIRIRKDKKKIVSELINLGEVNFLKSDVKQVSSGKLPEFEIIGLNIEAEREVSSWCQPIIRDSYIRVHGFLTKKINNVLHFLIKANEEIGSVSGAEIGPTVQGISRDDISASKELFVRYFAGSCKVRQLLSVMQSDEGGRFFKVQNLHMIVLTDDEVDLPDNFRWATLYQLKELIYFGYVNMEARSIISCINFRE